MIHSIEKEKGEKYTKSYSENGISIMKIFDQDWLERIIKELPQHYRGLDIGSCDGTFSKQIINKSMEYGKKGEMVAIDPFPVFPDVIEIKGEDYCRKCSSEQYDLIICKYMIHFVENTSDFLQNMKRILRPNGKIYIMTLMPTSYFPWSMKIQQSFCNSCVELKSLESNLSEYFPNTWKRYIYISNQSLATTASQERFIEMLRGRGFSHLIPFHDSEIQGSIQEFSNLYLFHPENCNIHLEVAFYHCVKPQ